MRIKIEQPKINIKAGVAKITPSAESLEITPSKDAQSFQGLYDNVSVSGDNNLIAENIKKDVSIFGVEGSYDPEIGEYLSNDEAIIKYHTTVYKNFSGFSSHIREIKNLDISEYTTLLSFFENFKALEKVTFKKLPNKPITYQRMFYSCISLEDISDLDTSKATSLSDTFSGCSNLKHVSVLDTTSLSDTFSLSGTFRMCPLLTEASLNNIMEMCINATVISGGWETLKDVGLTRTQAETCMTLSNYQAFLDAGWTTGY